MKRLTGQDFETIVYELLIFRESRPFQDHIAAIGFIAEKRMPDILEMDPDLMCTACLKLAIQ